MVKPGFFSQHAQAEANVVRQRIEEAGTVASPHRMRDGRVMNFSLITQRHHRIDTRGPARGNDCGDQRGHAKQQRGP
jgi:hypothetical protein